MVESQRENCLTKKYPQERNQRGANIQRKINALREILSPNLQLQILILILIKKFITFGFVMSDAQRAL